MDINQNLIFMHLRHMLCSTLKLTRFTFTNFSRAMAPAVEQSPSEQLGKVPEHNDTEHGIPPPSVYNQEPEAPMANGNVKFIVILYNL
jgi:hypothetical protein